MNVDQGTPSKSDSKSKPLTVSIERLQQQQQIAAAAASVVQNSSGSVPEKIPTEATAMYMQHIEATTTPTFPNIIFHSGQKVFESREEGGGQKALDRFVASTEIRNPSPISPHPPPNVHHQHALLL
jgi:hypothetical protein